MEEIKTRFISFGASFYLPFIYPLFTDAQRGHVNQPQQCNNYFFMPPQPCLHFARGGKTHKHIEHRKADKGGERKTLISTGKPSSRWQRRTHEEMPESRSKLLMPGYMKRNFFATISDQQHHIFPSFTS